MSSVRFDEVIESSSLTVLEAAELSKLLEDRWGVSTATATVTDDASTEDLAPEEWLAADLIVLKAEAVALAESLDQTRAYVQARCRQVMAA
jgi:ribosomal protein L7/L12